MEITIHDIPFLITNIDAEIASVIESCIPDDTEYTVVDGEEGDYGNIRYFHKTNGKLVATLKILGGDDEEWIFSDIGKLYLVDAAIGAIRKTFVEM